MEWSASEETLRTLYERMRELHANNQDGVWARIIKNAFAPLLLARFDFVIGNPPWVNWEHLPDEYRDSTKPLWLHYGLFPKRERGMDTILGAAKYDISMLMTYVAVDRYLEKGGRLGFVVPKLSLRRRGRDKALDGLLSQTGRPLVRSL